MRSTFNDFDNACKALGHLMHAIVENESIFDVRDFKKLTTSE